MHVLFLSAWFPHPPSNGSRLRIAQLLRALAPQHEITLLSFADQPDVDPRAPELAALCRAVHVVPLPRFEPTAWRSRLAILDRRPRSLVATFSPPMAAAIAQGLRGGAVDAVVASELTCAAYAPWFEGVPALFEDVELGALHGRLAQPSAARRWRARLTWIKHRRYLRHLLRSFRACTVVSEPERELLAGVIDDPHAIHVLPNGVAAAEYGAGTAAARPDTVIFTGSFRYRPNYDAMRWFLAEVWPRVRQAHPNARLVITGAHDGLPLPGGAEVVRTGYIDDVRPLLAESRLAVAPIFTGGGTRLKILEAMASGTPVVATAKGAEGIEAVAGEHLLIADDPFSFAAAVVAVLREDTLHTRLGRAARNLIERCYDWRVLGPRFEALVRSVADA